MSRHPTASLDTVFRVVNDKCEPRLHPTTLFNYIGLEDIESNTGVVRPKAPVQGATIRSAKSRFRANDVLYGRLRPNLNKVHLADSEGVSSTDILVLRADLSRVDVRFAAYYLRSPQLLTAVTRRVAGAHLPRISADALLALPIPLPSLDVQTRVASLLDGAAAMQTLQKEATRRTADLIPAMFYEMFGDPRANPMGFTKRRIEQLFPPDGPGTRCGPFGSALKKDEYVQQGVPVWGIDNVRLNSFVEEGSLFITREKYGELRGHTVKNGDILISRAGTVGRMCVARPSCGTSIIGSNLIRLRLDQIRVVPEYVSTSFSLPEATRGFRADSDTRAYSFMNTGVLARIEILVPPVALQRSFAERLVAVREMQREQAAAARQLDALFQSLLHRAFNGEL